LSTINHLNSTLIPYHLYPTSNLYSLRTFVYIYPQDKGSMFIYWWNDLNLKTNPKPIPMQSTDPGADLALEFEPNSSQFVEIESNNESGFSKNKPTNSSSASTANFQEE
jgi:hypothetical protein